MRIQNANSRIPKISIVVPKAQKALKYREFKGIEEIIPFLKDYVALTVVLPTVFLDRSLKKTIDRVGLTLSEKRCFISALQQEHSVRDICEILGVNRSSFYYQPREDPFEAVLRAEIEKLAERYPRYGYRRITQRLLRQGYTIGYRRVARLMKAANLSVSVKRFCQTTKSLQGERPYVNRLQTLEVSRCDQVWVGDITYVRLKGHFIYVSLLMDVFTRVIRVGI